MHDYHTLIISDIHLGTRVCNTEKLLTVLRQTSYTHLVINGDLFDGNNIARLSPQHKEVLTVLADIANKKKVFLIGGNHGRKLDSEVTKMGIEIRDTYAFAVENNRFLCVHGDEFDFFVRRLKRISKIAGSVYGFLQRFSGKKQRFSHLMKRMSKNVLGVPKRQQRLALRHAVKHDASVIICSHTHVPHDDFTGDIRFINTGSFCDQVCHFVTIDNKGVPLLHQI